MTYRRLDIYGTNLSAKITVYELDGIFQFHFDKNFDSIQLDSSQASNLRRWLAALELDNKSFAETFDKCRGKTS